MKKLLLLLAGTVLVTLAVVPVAAPANPPNAQCIGTLTPGTYNNVTVPAGFGCGISGATITGNLIVQTNADAEVIGSTTIDGNYICNDCFFADLHDSTVGGNYLISGELDGSDILGNTINGSLQITMSSADGFHFLIAGNNVGGNLTFNENTGTSTIAINTIGNNLQCQNNVPAPTSFGHGQEPQGAVPGLAG